MKVNVGVIGVEEPPLGCESSSCSSASNNVFLDVFFNPRRAESTQTVIDFNRGAKKRLHPSSPTLFLASASPFTQAGNGGPVSQLEISLFAS